MTNELATVTNVVSREITGLDVVSSVNRFYSGAFDHLFALVLALIALFGVILPILIQIYQRRVMKVSESELKAEMVKLFEEKKVELISIIEEKIASEKESITAALDKNTATIKKRLATAEGYSFHMLGNSSIEKGAFFAAGQHLCRAAELYCSSDNGADLQTVINILSETVLPKLNKKDLERNGFQSRLEDLFKQLGKMEHHGFLRAPLRDLAEALRQAKSRESVKV